MLVPFYFYIVKILTMILAGIIIFEVSLTDLLMKVYIL